MHFWGCNFGGLYVLCRCLLQQNTTKTKRAGALFTMYRWWSLCTWKLSVPWTTQHKHNVSRYIFEDVTSVDFMNRLYLELQNTKYEVALLTMYRWWRPSIFVCALDNRTQRQSMQVNFRRCTYGGVYVHRLCALNNRTQRQSINVHFWRCTCVYVRVGERVYVRAYMCACRSVRWECVCG